MGKNEALFLQHLKILRSGQAKAEEMASASHDPALEGECHMTDKPEGSSGLDGASSGRVPLSEPSLLAGFP